MTEPLDLTPIRTRLEAASPGAVAVGGLGRSTRGP
jgi:hypothetical protein